MECISYNYVKVRVNLPPLGPVLLLLVGEAPLLVGDVPLLLGDVPLLVGDVPLLVGDVPLLVEEASLLVVGVFVLSGCFFMPSVNPSLLLRGKLPLLGVLVLVYNIAGNVPLIVEDVLFTRPQEKDK